MFILIALLSALLLVLDSFILELEGPVFFLGGK